MKDSTKKALLMSFVVVCILLALRVAYLSTQEGFQGSAGADTFTLYYADWCPHCKTVKPIFAEYIKKGSMQVNGKTVFLTMVETDSNPEKMKGKPVKGFPTFLLEKADGSFKEFDGERTPAGWTRFLEENGN